MDVAASNAVSTALYMNQAQTAEQAQMQMFRQALDMQAEQITEVLASSDAKGACYVETKGLDGETNLKTK